MNAEEILIRYGGRPVDRLPEEIRARLERDDGLLRLFQEQAAVASLMSLKRHEIPDPALEGRLIHRVGIRVRNAPSARPRLSHTFHNLPSWARMAAVVAVMLSLSILTHKEMLRSEAGTAEASALELANSGRELVESGVNLDPGSLNHLDPFTTLLPGGFPQPEENLPLLRDRGLATAQTNSLWNAPPISLPVLFPAP